MSYPAPPPSTNTSRETLYSSINGFAVAVVRRNVASTMTNRIEGTLRALEFIANHLSRLPGRKNLIWVSGGFPLSIGFENLAAWRNPAIEQRTFTDEVSRTVRALNNANIAIYPVDARGLMVDPRFDASRRTANLTVPTAPVGVRNQDRCRN